MTGSDLRRRREALRVASADLARALGISPSAVSHMEARGRLGALTELRYELALERCAAAQQKAALSKLAARASGVLRDVAALVPTEASAL